MPRTPTLYDDLFAAQYARTLAAAAVCLILVFTVGHAVCWIADLPVPATVRFHLNLDAEGNLATWLNALLLLCASLAAFTVDRFLAAHDPTRARRSGWFLTGLTFFCLATDEAAQVHDTLGYPLARLAGSLFPSLPYHLRWYAWIPVFVVLGILTAILLARLLRTTLFRSRSASRWVLAGAVCFALNPVVEIQENLRVDRIPAHLTHLGPPALRQSDPAAWTELQILIIIEESLEMLGAVCFLVGFLSFGRHALRELPAPPPHDTAPDGDTPGGHNH